ncbi:MAG: U32 family peptidase [Deltaproteobacteria bacterium]|nr:U32 family peptidase [Deltaproteobacteria bacterium]
MCAESKHACPAILAPAGGRASFLAAVAAGADEIYCGLKRFSARMEAKNVTPPQLGALVRLAHDRGVKVHVALNTVVKAGELEEAGSLLALLSKQIRPDGLIVQDIGLARLARQAGYSGELHLSTLANVSFPAALSLVRRDLGVDRVVVPRELDVDEIRAMGAACVAGLRLEVFVHGALCYGVSGRCYWSSYLGGKSGLRGRCVQPCRRVYVQGRRRQRFFSCCDLSLDVLAKVLLTVPQVAAWKIEGRKKGPHYVYHTVKAYRIFRDHGSDPVARREALRLLALALGRPTVHYRFLPQRVQDPVKTDVQTGSGLLVGHTKGGRQRAYITVREALLAGDSLRVGTEDEGWHVVFEAPRAVPKKGRLDIQPFLKRSPAKGTPVFLVDRKQPVLKQALRSLDTEMSSKPRIHVRHGAFYLKLPRRLKNRPKPVEVCVYRMRPDRRSCRGGLELWLSSEAMAAIGEGKTWNRLWWWMPPVLWPKDEARVKALVGKAIKAGSRHFVLNAPWQRTLFSNPKSVILWAGPFCNLANPLALMEAARLGCRGAIVSPELGASDYLELGRHSPIPLGIVISGYWPLTISRARSRELKTRTPFLSPKAEMAWAQSYQDGTWVYPNWPLDLRSQMGDLKRAGYCRFVHLFEPVPTGVKIKRRPGRWNWDHGLA